MLSVWAASWAARGRACLTETVDVFIESAYFDALRTARTGRATGIISDARYRNERGIDPSSCLEGLELATRLILWKSAAATPQKWSLPGPFLQRRRRFSSILADVKRLTGVEVKTGELRQIVKDLGFDIRGHGRGLVCDPAALASRHSSSLLTSWKKSSVSRAMMPWTLTSLPPLEGGPKQVLTESTAPGAHRAPCACASRGFLETVTWSFVSREEAKQFGGGKSCAGRCKPRSI